VGHAICLNNSNRGVSAAVAAVAVLPFSWRLATSLSLPRLKWRLLA
jgi:hypothetical protein